MALQLAANLSLLFPADTAWADRCQRAAKQGFRFAEILFPYNVPASDYRRWLDDAGLEAVLINTPVEGHSGLAAVKDAETRFQRDIVRAVETANVLGARAIHVMAGRSESGVEVDQTTLLHNLEFALHLVEGTGITLMLEALNQHDMPGYFYHAPEEVVAILKQLPSPKLRQQFDFYHTLREGLALLDELDRCRPYIGHVQIAQPPTRCEPRLEESNMLPALHRLEEWKYSGWVGCEYRPASTFEAGIDWIKPLQA